MGPYFQSTAWEAVKVEDRVSERITELGKAEIPSIRQFVKLVSKAFWGRQSIVRVNVDHGLHKLLTNACCSMQV